MYRRTMHIGIDSHAAEHSGEGNSTYIQNLILALVGLDGDHTLALLAADPSHPFYRSLPAGARCRISSIGRHGGVARTAWALPRAARRERVDCLHVQYFAPPLYRRPVVVTVHDLGFLHVPDSFPSGLRFAMRVLVPWSVRRAARVITDSEFSRNDMVARYQVSPQKIVVIRLSAPDRFRPMDMTETSRILARYGLKPGFLFSLGRLNRRKNLARLLMAYRALRADGIRDVPLVVAGKPDYGARDLRAAAGFEAFEGIHWVGLIPDDDLPAFYAGARCFVYPSLFEGFGLPLLEAMASECPVISSDRAALPELVGDAGLLVDPERVEAIAEAMRRVLTDASLRTELRERGLRRSRQFTWQETARRTLEVYRQAAARCRAGSAGGLVGS